jgi:hypothetical protein
VRLSDFRDLMVATLGPHRAITVADDHVFAALGGRTATEAIRAGVDPKLAWRAVSEAYDIPPQYHHGLPD